MIKKTLRAGILFYILSFSNFAQSQGCSDAGFCTLDDLKPHQISEEINRDNLKVGLSFGAADFSITVLSPYIQYKKVFSNKFSINAKLTGLSQSGNNISTFGLSDIYLNSNYKLSDKTSIIVGTKIPLSKANKSENGLPLPLDYQSSLGTFDLIFGLNYKFKKIQLTAAVQQPLSQNDNEFLASNYPLSSPLSAFPSTNNFKRSGDIMLRAAYPAKINEKFTITPSILPIYHLKNDKFTDISGVEQEINGSKGLTLNANVYLDYELNEKSAIQLSLAAPLTVRDIRPDGLTRTFVANLEYTIKF